MPHFTQFSKRSTDSCPASASPSYCYPLTITDFASRYLLACEAHSTTKERYAFTVFERAFQEHGLPDAIRTDNGIPFASAHALYGLSKLAVWWLRLGIGLERIAPGHPEQNGRHERLHLTLKAEATRPPSTNVLQQGNWLAALDDFRNWLQLGLGGPRKDMKIVASAEWRRWERRDRD